MTYRMAKKRAKAFCRRNNLQIIALANNQIVVRHFEMVPIGAYHFQARPSGRSVTKKIGCFTITTIDTLTPRGKVRS